MAIYETLYPQGNFLNIRANAPTQADYNIRATEDLVRNLPGGLLKDIISPAMAATLSLPYDTIQGISRADSYTPSGIMKSIAAEKPLSSAYERFIGASAPLAERISDMFGMSKAEASDLGEVANLQSYTPNNLPFTSMSDMYNLSQRDLVDQINMGPRSITPPMTMDQMMYGSVLSNNIASPRTVLNQQTGIMQQAPSFNLDLSSLPANMGVANEEDVEQEFLPDQKSSLKDSLSNMGKKFGLSSLLGLITGNPIFGLISGGARGLGALNNKMQNSMFGQSKNLAEYFNNRKIAKATGSKDFMNRPRSERNYTGPSGGNNTGGDIGAKGAADSFSNKSGMGRTGY